MARRYFKTRVLPFFPTRSSSIWGISVEVIFYSVCINSWLCSICPDNNVSNLVLLEIQFCAKFDRFKPKFVTLNKCCQKCDQSCNMTTKIGAVEHVSMTMEHDGR